MPKLLTTPFAVDAESGYRTDIQVDTGVAPNSATYRIGFPPLTMRELNAGGIPPKGSDMNGVLYDITDNIVFQTQGNSYGFDPTYATLIGGYPLHSRLKLNNGDIVKSTVPNNLIDPNSNLTGWVKVNAASQIFDSSGQTQQQVNDAKANKATTLAGYGITDAYTKSQVDATVGAIANGSKSYQTLALAAAAASGGSIPANSSVYVTNDPTPSNNGLYTYDGTSLTKSVYDPVSIAAADATAKANAAEANANAYTDTSIETAVESANQFTIEQVADAVPVYQNRTENVIPIALDGIGNIALWIEDGKIAGYDVSDELKQKIINGAFDNLPKKNSIQSFGKLTPFTNGENLSIYRSRLSKCKTDNAGSVKVILDGDSWFQLTPIPDSFYKRFRDEYGISGVGWLGVVPDSSSLTGVTFNIYDNFTLKDYAQPPLQPAPTYGCGIDGFAIESSVNNSLLSVTLRTETFRIFYWDGNGTFRYRVDGGAWNTIASTGANAKANVLISGLSDTSHTFEIDTTGNTGTVTIHGFYATRSLFGVELSRCGNGDQSGRDASIFADQIPYFANIINPDVVIVLLGTNEVRFGRSVESYVQGLTDKVAAYRSVKPNIGVIIAFPAQCGSDISDTERLYRDAGIQFAIDNNCEWYSGFDLFADYETENAVGVWSDPNHLNNAGAMAFTSICYKNFFGGV